MKSVKPESLALIVLILLFNIYPNLRSSNFANAMDDYCYLPPFVGSNAPSLVTFVIGRDHKLYYEAYNDASDLDEDGRLDIGYKHSIDYYGYFDPYKCYEYRGNWRFEPTRVTTNKYCGRANEWSGNFLNWLTMSRIDVLRKALYGGYRGEDAQFSTTLYGTYIPQDAHSWGKQYNGADTRQLTPFNQPPAGQYIHFCVVSTGENQDRVIRVRLNQTSHVSTWASKERPVCDGSANYEYSVRVKVCDPSVGLEPNCKRYPGSNGILGDSDDTYKPIGLLQKYGDPEDRNSKWCSKSLKPCGTDNDCNPSSTHGQCVEKSNMYFALISGSYMRNISGGVLRKSMWTIADESDPGIGTFRSTDSNNRGGIIKTLNNLRVTGFTYGSGNYYYSTDCGWITDGPLSEGRCRMWGNPIGEMVYEALRYLAGKTSPTSDFLYSNPPSENDDGLSLPNVPWTRSSGNIIRPPYETFPMCSKPFLVIISDVNNSYDSDKLPGSQFGSISTDLQNLNVTTLTDEIGTRENISGNFFVGQSGSNTDFLCSSKYVSSLSSVRGLCPEEPTKQGSFYLAGLAYYANKADGWRNNFSGQKPPPIKTLSVALASPIPEIALKAGNNTVRIVPTAKSVSGCAGVHTACFSRCSVSRDSTGNLRITNCASNAFCPTNQIVDLYIDNVNYNSNGDMTYIKFRINFEDVEQGADHDMDAVVEYEIQVVSNNQVKVKLTSTYAAGCMDQVAGFVISGTTEDGTWLVVRDNDATQDGDTPQLIANMPTSWERTFTVGGTAAGQLKSPLWYAAKWGGFNDINGNGIPDLQSEWDENGDGVPDTYFHIVNPLKMERELEKVFVEILKRSSSGATVATLASRYQTSSIVVQPSFIPEFSSTQGTSLRWIGNFRGFWIDSSQNFREDTKIDKKLTLYGNDKDLMFKFFYDGNSVKAALVSDPESCTSVGVKEHLELSPVLQFDCRLASTSKDSRKILFNKDGTIAEFTTSERSYLRNIWASIDSSINDTQTDCIINYHRGEYDYTWDCSRYVKRKRNIDISQICKGYSQGSTVPWKMGAITYSTPVITGNQGNNLKYIFNYEDNTYSNYINSDRHKNRRSVAIVGTNQGLVHFFRLGFLKETKNTWQPVEVVDAPNSDTKQEIEKEELAFIPRNALAYMLWYGREDYCSRNRGYVPIVDYRLDVFDASFDKTDNPTAQKTADSWNTFLFGSMGMGGKKLGVNSSSIFLLKLTNYLNDNSGSTNPELMWEITLDQGELATSYPARIRQGDRNQNGRWYFILGSGPLDPNADSYTKFHDSPKLYIINARNGSKVKIIDLKPLLPSGVRAAVGDIMEFDMDDDYQDDVIYFGMYGYDSSNRSWGGIFRVALKTEGGYIDPSNITLSNIKKVIELGDFAISSQTPPVFAAPAATLDENGNVWVFFNTGLYLSLSHRIVPYRNYIIAIKDPCWDSANKRYISSCNTVLRKWQLADSNNISGYNNCSTSALTFSSAERKTICDCDSSGCSRKSVVVSTNAQTDNCVLSNDRHGWFYELQPNHIAYSRPLVSFGTLLSMNFKPSDDPCLISGESFITALYYKNGLPPSKPSLVTLNNVSGNSLRRDVSIGYGSPPLGEVFRFVRSSATSGNIIGQTSSGALFNPEQQLRGNRRGKFILWIEK